MAKNDGGPAFPVDYYRPGLTRRQYYAAKILQGAMVNAEGMTECNDDYLHAMSREIFRIADAMIAYEEGEK